MYTHDIDMHPEEGAFHKNRTAWMGTPGSNSTKVFEQSSEKLIAASLIIWNDPPPFSPSSVTKNFVNGCSELKVTVKSRKKCTR